MDRHGQRLRKRDTVPLLPPSGRAGAGMGETRMTKWNWTPKAYRLRDNLIALACWLMLAGVIALFLIKATN